MPLWSCFLFWKTEMIWTAAPKWMYFARTQSDSEYSLNVSMSPLCWDFGIIHQLYFILNICFTKLWLVSEYIHTEKLLWLLLFFPEASLQGKQKVTQNMFEEKDKEEKPVHTCNDAWKLKIQWCEKSISMINSILQGVLVSLAFQGLASPPY